MTLDSRSDALDQRLQDNDIDSSIATLVKDANRRKLQLRLLTLSVLLNILLTVGFGYLAYTTNKTANLAQSNKDAVIANCEVSNDSRKNNRELWAFAFSFPPDQPRTEIQNQRVEQFKAYIAKTFAERDCQAEINK